MAAGYTSITSTLLAMEPEARLQHAGNCLYPGVAHLSGEQLAGKITGMLLELPTEQLADLVGNFEALRVAVTEAIAVLPADLKALAVQAPAPSAASPTVVSPVSVLGLGPSGEALWADNEEEEEDGELPPINALLDAAERKKRPAKDAAAPVAADAMDVDAAADGWVCEWEMTAVAAKPVEELCAWIAERLEEPHVRIVQAVVEILGVPAALGLLASTERVQATGGCLVPETGKPRTSGGIYVKLLKEAANLPEEKQQEALVRIKVEGNEAKKAKEKARDAAKRSRPPASPRGPRSPSGRGAAQQRVASASPTKGPQPPAAEKGPPKPAFGDFLAATTSLC